VYMIVFVCAWACARVNMCVRVCVCMFACMCVRVTDESGVRSAGEHHKSLPITNLKQACKRTRDSNLNFKQACTHLHVVARQNRTSALVQLISAYLSLSMGSPQDSFSPPPPFFLSLSLALFFSHTSSRSHPHSRSPPLASSTHTTSLCLPFHLFLQTSFH